MELLKFSIRLPPLRPSTSRDRWIGNEMKLFSRSLANETISVCCSPKAFAARDLRNRYANKPEGFTFAREAEESGFFRSVVKDAIGTLAIVRNGGINVENSTAYSLRIDGNICSRMFVCAVDRAVGGD